jgi:hypothetical protein
MIAGSNRGERHGTRMTGRVFKIDRDFVHVVLEDGQRCWFDKSGDDIGIGDIVTGNLRTHGDEKLFNTTKGYTMSVYMQGHT